MKEIKFRSWVSVIGKYMYWGIGDVNKDGAYFSGPPNDAKAIHQQFTGLKDRGGVDIYDGDILAVYDWGIKNNKLFGKVEVKWDDTEKGWRHGDCGVDIDVYDMFRNVKVIGNILENPELIKVKP